VTKTKRQTGLDNVALKVEQWPIDRPKPYARNARKISDAAISKVAASLSEFGWRQPIVVDEAGVIIAGHTRLLAAKKLGMTEVPVHVAVGLTPEQVKAYRLMDNRSHEEAEWDLALLAPEIADLQALAVDLSLTGFDEDEITRFLADAGATEGLTDPDAVPDTPEAPVIVSGDLWLLGRHRLLCGDSTSIDAVDRLMGGDRCNLCFTSPPYNAGAYTLTGNVKKQDKSSRYDGYSDDLPEDEYVDFLCAFTSLALTQCDVVAVNIQQLANNKFAVLRWVGHFLENFIDRSVWYKGHGNPAMAPNVMASRFEDIWLFSPDIRPNRAIKTAAFRGTVENVVESVGASAENDFQSTHAATMPSAVARYAIESFSQAGHRVFDPFGGTGTTMVVSEKCGRDARLLEMNPSYCDVIVKRWQQFTGLAATLDGDGRTFDEIASERFLIKLGAQAALKEEAELAAQ
jgi:DNA modification methylase